ncbi:hypothetical protein HAZT_HAZT001544 [Hyalella azteca]|uniref:Uncharacterized protein n=1 Tax=Hyalella azteca TaxID=294128 RepID=A0A6A0GRM3_HYAAZ|nr:hypothetical protein HAZT_HAZT001544 [Hyalella azteca]
MDYHGRYLVVLELLACLLLSSLILPANGETASVETIDMAEDLAEDLAHPCHRNCSDQPHAMVCNYHFKAEWYTTLSKACYDCPDPASDCRRAHCVAADGVKRPIVTVNRRMPGPSIQVG